MKSKYGYKLISIVLCVVMICSSMNVLAAEPEIGTDESGTIEAGAIETTNDYYRQYAKDLLQKEAFVATNENVKLSVNEETGKVIVSGKKADLLDNEFTVKQPYNFDAGQVGRFSFEISAAKSQKIMLGFYLDEQTEPFVEKQIVAQRKKGLWDDSKEYTVDVTDLHLTGKHTLRMKVLSASSTDTSFAINWFEFVESSVPVIYFNIDETQGTINEMNTSEEHTAECYGSMTIQVPEGATSVDTGKALKGGTYELDYIRGRGNSTWSVNKKPYKVKLESGANLLGLGKNKHWVLLANYFDNSLLRNRITYWIGKQLGMPYTPESEPVDVVMNGEYYGSYFLSEQIRVGSNRVEIDDLEDSKDATDEETISGGYLLSMFPYDEEATKKQITTNHHVEYLIESPEFDGYYNEAQYQYIQNYIQSVEDAIYGEDFKNAEGVSYKELMDVTSSALYYWIQEFSMNGDGYSSGSTYLYKPRNDKLYWGPLWDFDYVAWGSIEYNEFHTKGWAHNSNWGNWNERLFEDKEYAEAVVALWPKVKEAVEETIKPGGQLDKYAENMKLTAKYNFEKWGPTKFDEEDYSTDISDCAYTDESETKELTYDEEIERLRNWSKQRLSWIDRHVKELVPEETTVSFANEDGKIFHTQTEIIGKNIRSYPEVPKKDGFVFSAWEYERTMTLKDLLESYDCDSEEELRKTLSDEGMEAADIDELIETYKKGVTETVEESNDITVLKDMVLKAKYVSNDDIVKTEKLEFARDQYYALYYGEGEGGSWIDFQYQVIPFDATFTSVKLSSDNESVLAFDEDGEAQIKGAGDAVITATTSEGVTATTKLHVYSSEEADSTEGIYDSAITIAEKMTLNSGEYAKLPLIKESENAIFDGNPDYFVTNDDILEIGSAGIVRALNPGNTYLICNSNGKISICRVSVYGKEVTKGTKVTYKGIRYQVTSNTKKSKKVICIGPKDSKIKKVVIPNTIPINGKKYKVTEIKASAFKDCKKLVSVKIGKYVEIIGKSAFKNCKNLKKIKLYTKQPKIYKSTFAKISKKARFTVPRKARKYYKIVLKGKRIR